MFHRLCKKKHKHPSAFYEAQLRLRGECKKSEFADNEGQKAGEIYFLVIYNLACSSMIDTAQDSFL